jgi:hypothetical protein
MDSPHKILVGIVSAVNADILSSQLAKAGVQVVTVFNHSTCRGGCAPSKEIWAHPDDASFIQGFMDECYRRDLLDLGADPKQVGQVFDLDKPSAICPACGATFSTTQHQCPQCELAFFT